MILLVMITAVGMVCHNHRDSASSANCTLCHMAIEPALSGAVQRGLVLKSSEPTVQYKMLYSRLSALETGPRAPPA